MNRFVGAHVLSLESMTFERVLQDGSCNFLTNQNCFRSLNNGTIVAEAQQTLKNPSTHAIFCISRAPSDNQLNVVFSKISC